MMEWNWVRVGGEVCDCKALGEAAGEPEGIWHCSVEGVALEVWLLGKVCWTAPDVSGRKKVVLGQNEPGRKHPELEFKL